MKKATLVVALLVIISTFYLGLTILPESVRANILYVGGTGPGNYTTLQSAIDNATDGDMVFVYNGTYYEHVVVNRSLSLVGEDRDTTIIDGGGSGDVIYVDADWVNISELTIVNSGSEYPDVGIELNFAHNCSINNNTISSNADGIYLESSNDNMIANNTVLNNRDSGIYLRWSNNNTVNNTVFSNNRFGIKLFRSNINTIANNTISAWDYGVYFYDSINNILAGNAMMEDGIRIWGDLPGYWNTHTIDASNTVNGEPIYYLKNVVAGSIPSAAGQVIVANCTSMVLENQNISNSSVSFLLGFSRGIDIDNNTISLNNSKGFEFQYSFNITFVDNDISSNMSIIFVSDSYNITLADNNISSNGGSIFVFGDSYSITITNNSISPGGVHCQSRFGKATIANNTISRSSGGIYLLGFANTTIANNTILNNELGGITVGGINNTIANNTLLDNGYGILSYGRNHTIANNAVHGNRDVGIFLASSYNSRIVNNTVSNSTYGVAVSESENSIVMNNFASSNDDGIYLNRSNGNWIASNNGSNNKNGIWLWSSRRNFITNNAFSSNSKDGIYLHYSDSNSITNNTASLNSWRGLTLSSSQGNIIANNTASSNKRYGIHLVESLGNNVNNNTASNNLYGIYLGHSSDINNIVNNTISSNTGYGVYLELGSTLWDRIYHNNFIDNARQAYGGGDLNEWDDGYPSGGNYWSDYTGVDEKSGPNQDEPGADGIGDTPYDVSGPGKDQYPLMSSFQMMHPLPPVLLHATLSGNDLENVTLTWLPSLDDGRGLNSVTGYEIYRNLSYNLDGVGYELIAFLPNGTFEFVDNHTGEGNPNNYFYQVCALDLNNRTKCAANQAAKFTRPLSEGPNLVSNPLVQSDNRVETVFQTLKWDKAWSYDPSIKEWKWHMSFKPYPGTLDRVTVTEGIWVNVTEASNLTIAGIVPSEATVHLRKGWNLVGFPSFKSIYTVGSLKASTSTSRVEGFDPSSPPYFLELLQDSDVLVAGQGYWLEVAQDEVLIVSNV